MIAFRLRSMLFGCLMLAAFPLTAQIDLEIGGTPQSLADIINGNGVQILNATVNCADGAYGTYNISGIADFPDGQGVVLSTGKIDDMRGPNLSQTTTTEWGTPGDQQITAIVGVSSFDACVFEFDVIPVGDTLRFNFTFASEEYEEYVGTQFNDAFAFLISGPGITGTPGLGGFENIALVPNTTTPVSINTVNNGNPDIGFPAVNPEFFISNPPSFSSTFEYDGFTTGLFAQRVLNACDTFRLKLVIADVGDRKWDSSVFIEAIESNSVTLTATTDGGIEEMIEGCNSGTVVFTRSPVTNEPLEVTFFIGGTAINGGDYPPIGNPNPLAPKFITIPANQATASITIEPFDDGIAEGLETITFYVGNPLCPGTVQDSLTIGIIDELLVAVVPPLSFICPGDSLAFTVNGLGNNFSWSPADFLNDPTIKEPTSTPPSDIIYTLTSTVSACVATTTAEIRVSNLVLGTSTVQIECGGANDGAIDLTVNGGETPYEFEWTGPAGFAATTQNISGLAPGAYTVLVTDREGCTATTTANISENPTLQVALTSPEFTGGNNVSCNESSNGQATVSVQGGTPPYTFLWNDSDGQTNPTATGLSAGTYAVTVTDANGCTSDASITLMQPEPITGNLEERIDVLCFGQSTGSLNIGATGGTAPYTYIWNTTPPQAGPEASGIPAGIFTVTITDVNGCVGFAEAQISQPDAPLNGEVVVGIPTCSGDADGTATAVISGGTAPYTYTWSPQPGANTPSIDGLANGQYNLTVTDDNGCVLSIPFNVLGPSQFALELTNSTPVDCFGAATGAATVAAVGGTAPFTFVWNTIPPTNGNNVSNLPAGTYTVTATDNNGCTAALDVVIGAPADGLAVIIATTTPPLCDGDDNGSITAEASGGTAPYSYTWNTVPPSEGSTLSNVPQGSYTVTVTDTNGCAAEVTAELNAPEPITLTISSLQNVLCSGASTGSATVIATGGTAPYIYIWNDPLFQTTPAANNLTAGTYTVSVQDDNGCSASLQVTITEPAASLGGTVVDELEETCFGFNNGSATVAGTGGSGSYSYQWNDPAAQQTSTASNLAQGSYAVTITDNNGCATPVVLNVEIGGPTAPFEVQLLPSIFTGGFNLVCESDENATIDLTISGGTAPFTVLWDLPGLDTSTDLSLIDLGPGIYSVVVTDANGCTAEGSVTLTAPEAITVSSTTTPSLCFGQPTGSLSITIGGGVPGYSVTWTGPNGFVGSGLALDDLVGGIYIATVTDASGCITLEAVTVIQPDDIVITIDNISDINGFNTSCWNSQDGSISVTPSGGLEPYSFAWNRPGNPNFSNQQNVTNIAPGNYEVVVTDANGCVQNAFIEMVGPTELEVAFTGSIYDNGFNISCNGQIDGSLSAEASGGTPGYTYTWIGNGGFGPVFGNSISNLAAGEYSVLVLDANNCNFANTFVLTQPPAFSINLIAENINGGNVSCEGSSDGVINLIVSGNTGPYSFAWTGPDGFTSTNEDLSNVGTGTYCVVVSDANDCTQSACIDIDAPEALAPNLIPFLFPNGGNISCPGFSDGAIDAAVAGGTAPYNYSWSGSGNYASNQANISGLPLGTYCLTVTDANGCSATRCETLILASPPLGILLTLSSPQLCSAGNAAAINSTVSGGIEPYNYVWSGPGGFIANSPSVATLVSGTYCVIVTDFVGCEELSCLTVAPVPVLSVSLTPLAAGVSCNGSVDGFVNSAVSGGAQPYTYSWTGPDGFSSNSPNISELGAGTYCLEVTDANGCVVEQCATVIEPDAILVNTDISLPPCDGQALATVTLEVSGGTAPYSFNWSTQATTSTVLLGAGTYTVIVSDANNCSLTLPVNVEFPADIVVTLQSPIFPGGVNITCNGAATGMINTTVTGGTGPFEFDWSGTDNFISDEMSLIGMNAGTYCILVTDDLGCSGSACITIIEPNAISVALSANDVACGGELTGSASANVSGGVPPLIINWTGPNGFTAMGTALTGLAAGNYCITVTDLNGCTANDCILINEPLPLLVNLSSAEVNGVNIACFGENSGSITTSLTGGSPAYTYSWEGPNGFFSPSPNIENLFAGDYCLTVTDASGCIVTSCITLTEADGLDFDFDVFEFGNGFNTTCAGTCDGSLTLSLTGGTAPIEVSWTGPNNFSSDQLILNNLCPGVYEVTTTDGAGCIQSSTVEVTQAPELNLSAVAPAFDGGTEINCFGAENGVINTTLSGGVPPYVFSWSGPNDFTSSSASLTDLGPGTYTLEVTDATGCSTAANVTITQPEAPLSGIATAFEFPSGDNISCLGINDGSITAEAIGGIAPYNYFWLGPNDFAAQGSSIDGLEAGQYTLVIEDANSCVFTIIVDLGEPETVLESNVISTTTINCHDAASGAIEVGAAGGNPPYEITWIGPFGFTGNTFVIDGLPPGTYSYAVTDINGCSVSGAVTLNNPLQVTIDANIIAPNCLAENGIINITIAGGTPPYATEWNTGETSQNLVNIGAGDYILFVTDANGCEAEAAFPIDAENNLEVEADITTPNCSGDSNGVLQVALVEGAQPVTYTWEGPNGFTASGNTLVNIAAGIYSLTAIDANGCLLEQDFTVGEPQPLTADELVSPLYPNGYNLTGFQTNDGVINNPDITGGTAPYTLSWTGPDGFTFQGAGPVAGLAAGLYTLTVRDARNCTFNTTIALTEPLVLELPNGISPNGDGFNDGLIVRGLDAFPNNKLMVYNRWGNLLYEENNYNNMTPWAGTNNSGELLPEGTYFVIVDIRDRDSLRGYLELRR